MLDHPARDVVLSLIAGGDQAIELVACPRHATDRRELGAMDERTEREAAAADKDDRCGAAALSPLRCVDPENPNLSAGDHEGIAIDHAGAADDVAGYRY